MTPDPKDSAERSYSRSGKYPRKNLSNKASFGKGLPRTTRFCTTLIETVAGPAISAALTIAVRRESSMDRLGLAAFVAFALSLGAVT